MAWTAWGERNTGHMLLATTAAYASDYARRLDTFNERFQDVKTKEQDLNIFVVPVNVDPADVPEHIQLEFRTTLDSRPADSLELYKLNVGAEQNPNVRKELKTSSLSPQAFLLKILHCQKTASVPHRQM